MKKTLVVLSILNLILLAIVFGLDESIYRQLGFSGLSIFHSYPSLPCATKYCNGNFSAVDKNGYSLMTVVEDVNGECLYTPCLLRDSSGKEITVAPREILRYAYSDNDLYICLKDSANVVYWIQPIPQDDIHTSRFSRYYDNIVVSEQDLNCIDLRMVNLYSWASLITLLVYFLCVILLVLNFVAIMFCSIGLFMARKS